jgi:hypothetical protein
MSYPENRVPRRSLIRWLLGFSLVSTLGGVLTPVVGYLWPPARARSSEGGRTLVGAVSDFPLNSGTVVSVNDEPVIVVNTEAGGIKAYSAICTPSVLRRLLARRAPGDPVPVPRWPLQPAERHGHLRTAAKGRCRSMSSMSWGTKSTLVRPRCPIDVLFVLAGQNALQRADHNVPWLHTNP